MPKARHVTAGGLSQTTNIVRESFKRALGLVEMGTNAIGVQPFKQLRVRVVILRDERGEPLCTIDDITASWREAQRIFSEQAHVRLVAAAPMALIVPQPAPAAALNVHCDDGAWQEDMDIAGDYFRHWIKMQRKLSESPRIFHVNWFRKDENGAFVWPGFGENMRVLKWIVERARGNTKAKETPIGWVPHYSDIEWAGLDFPEDKWDQLMAVDRDAWRREVIMHEELFLKLHDHLPKELIFERELLICRL